MGPLQIVFSVIIAILGTILSVFSSDMPPPNDSDMTLPEVTVRAEDNAYYSLTRIQMYLYEPKGGADRLTAHLVGTKWDDRFVRDILYRNEKAIQYFHEAALKPQFQDPTANDYEDPSFDAFRSFHEMARVSSLKAARLFKRGRDIEALAEALNILENGQKIQNAQGSVLHYVIAAHMKNIGLDRMRRISQSTRLSPEILMSYVGKLEKYKQNEEGLKTAFMHEYGFLVWAIDEVTSGQLTSEAGGVVKPLKSHRFYFKPNKTKSLFADFLRSQINNVDVPCGFRTVREVQRLTPSSMIQWFVTENLGGKILYDTAMPQYATSVHETRCDEDLSVSATQVLFALRAFKMETGQYPDSLDELVPRYINSVPEDPFDGKPLRYSPQKKIIYSVGMDLEDSGGREVRGRARTGGDYVFRINF
jgi:hypothetical protein